MSKKPIIYDDRLAIQAGKRNGQAPINLFVKICDQEAVVLLDLEKIHPIPFI